MKQNRILRLVIVWLVSLLLLGCRTIKHIHHETSSVEAVSTADKNKAIHVKDSVRWLDSVRTEYIKGDTDTLRIERWRLVEKTKTIHDTLTLVRTDTIKMYYNTYEQKKNNDLTWWQMALFCVLGGAIVVMLFYKDFMQYGRGGGKAP